jgi:hypothetical protein
LPKVDEARATDRARLEPSSRHDRERALQHDFANRLNELVFAVELQDRGLMAFSAEELKAMYRAAFAPHRRPLWPCR